MEERERDGKSMKYISTFTFLWCVLICCQSNEAQTLTEKLAAENPQRLLEQARKDGNIVRGAILFHQGNINCAKCHRPTSEKDRIGPDLSRLGKEVTDESLIESILYPSKVIDKEYETVTALTLDGQTKSGMIVSEDADQIVIRDNQDVDKLITIPRTELDGLRPGKLSAMPDKLADELKNRQQFLDLLLYVIDIKERGPNARTVVAKSQKRRELAPKLKGRVLIQQMNCVACHDADTTLTRVSAKQAPRLNWSAKYLNPNYVEAFIADPHGTQLGTSMPEMLGHLKESERTATAKAITHFIASKSSNEFASEAIDKTSLSDGFEIFHSVGCVACHSPRDAEAVERKIVNSVPLGDLSQKYNVTGLIRFLEDPLSARPSGHMPDMQLTHGEATDVANFLLQSSQGVTNEWKLDLQLAKQGETLFTKHNCASCHAEGMVDEPVKAGSVKLRDANPEKGCLSDAKGSWPNFHFTSEERAEIVAVLKDIPSGLNPLQQIDVSLTTFNCIACHDRGDLGGVTADRNPHFQTTDMNLGDQGRIPPTLTGVGAKLKKKWMRDVLVNRRSVRPYMKTRMPQYGEGNVSHLIELFQANDQLPETKFAKFDNQQEIRKVGLELAGNKGLNCVACHTYKFKLSDTMPAVDLTEMADRLKKDWFYQYMKEPQTFSPNTVMPSFWPGGIAIRKDIPGDPDDQIEALWQYLIDGRQAGTPSGVVRERLEIAVADEAKMLRRSYPGIGKRGIGVGYPGGVNLAYDAEQLRLATIWKGKFVDPGGVWTGQGSGRVRPMGKTFEFATGPELDSRNDPWVVDDGRPPRHQFLGYDLDGVQRPTFHYDFDGIVVSDYFMESVDEDSQKAELRRQLTLTSNKDREDVLFRIASAAEVRENPDGFFTIGKRLRVRVISGHTGRIVESEGTKRLEIPLELKSDERQLLELEYVWD